LEQPDLVHPMRRLGLVAALAALVQAATTQACPICMGLGQRTPSFAEQIIRAESVVVARAAGRRTFMVEKVLRGKHAALGESVTTERDVIGSRILLAYRNDKPVMLGSFNPSLQRFVESLLSMKTFEPADSSGWSEQLGAFRPYLGDRDPRVARSAWTAWALAPYEVLQSYPQLPDRERLKKWIGDPSRAGEASLYWRLLGLQADDAVRSQLREKVLASWEQNETRDLAALLDAELSANGKAAVTFICEHYIDDRERTLEEIQSALLALHMHGMKGAASMREPVAATFEDFVVSRRPLAGLVADDLAAWGRWKSSRTFSEIIGSGEPVLPTSRLAIIRYLKLCPEPGAREALIALKIPTTKP
jgi:hypothetical protein